MLFTYFWTENNIFKRALPQNVDIHGDVDKKRFLQNDLKRCALPRNVDIFGYIGKERFLKVIAN